MVNSSGPAVGAPAALTDNKSSPKYSEFRRVVRVFFGRKLAVIGLVFISLLVFTAAFAPLLTPYDPYQTSLKDKLQEPNREHLLGTDSVGRDTFSRILYGSRTSLLIGVAAVGLSSIIGMTMGLSAAYFGGWVYMVIMRITDALMAIPGIILVLLISGLVGGGIKIVIIALAIGGISPQCRLMCGTALSIKQNDYILAGRAMGMPDWRMMLFQVFPNAFPPLLVVITMSLGTVILAEATLSFLGIGILPPTCAWGSMVNDGYKYLLTNPILSFAPGAAIMMVVFGFNMMGDGLRDALDPKLRGAF
jgi:peptide/nickel transport system permease protein